MMPPENVKLTKRPYRKPQLERVQLKTEEAVLAACKARDGLINAWGTGECRFVFECRNRGS
jgi:hypothetical protein